MPESRMICLDFPLIGLSTESQRYGVIDLVEEIDREMGAPTTVIRKVMPSGAPVAGSGGATGLS